MQVITGGSGKLGRALAREFPSALRPTRAELELRDHGSVRAYFLAKQPSLVIHTSAMTDIRRAEQEREACWDMNVRGTERLVETLQSAGPDCMFVYLSTACVFDGGRGNYGEADVPDPKNYYALSKLVGEYVAQRMSQWLVVRTNFVERGPWPYPKAFVDRFGTYLYADDVARVLRRLVSESMTGLVHIAGDQRLSMYELARKTSPEVGRLTMADVNLPLTVDMTLRSTRIPPTRIS
ncbi:MAG TPA: sugar nucleotide-binding protein [Pirellulaceae bacterium]